MTVESSPAMLESVAAMLLGSHHHSTQEGRKEGLDNAVDVVGSVELTVHCQKSHKSIEIRTKSELTHKISSDNAATVTNLNEAHQRFSVPCWPFWFCNYLRQTGINLNSRKCCIKLLPYLGGRGVHTLSTYMHVERSLDRSFNSTATLPFKL